MELRRSREGRFVLVIESYASLSGQAHVMIVAAQKLAQRLQSFPNLKCVVFLTDSKVAEAYAGAFKDRIERRVVSNHQVGCFSGGTRGGIASNVEGASGGSPI